MVISMKKNLLLTISVIVAAAMLIACSSYDNGIAEPNETLEDETSIVRMSMFFETLSSIEDLASVSTDIIRAEVLDERVELVNIILPQNDYPEIEVVPEVAYEISTIHSLRVLEVFQGSSSVGDIVEVMQPGGQLENTMVFVNDKLHLTVGEDVIIFLVNHDTGLPMVRANPSQSAYRVPSYMTLGGLDLSAHESSILQAYSASEVSYDVVFESVNESNGLTLSIRDLVQIADAKVVELQPIDIEVILDEDQIVTEEEIADELDE
jgi:hypothetical protein